MIMNRNLKHIDDFLFGIYIYLITGTIFFGIIQKIPKITIKYTIYDQQIWKWNLSKMMYEINAKKVVKMAIWDRNASKKEPDVEDFWVWSFDLCSISIPSWWSFMTCFFCPFNFFRGCFRVHWGSRDPLHLYRIAWECVRHRYRRGLFNGFHST